MRPFAGSCVYLIGRRIADHTLLTRFRARLGTACYEDFFQQVVAQARQAEEVKNKTWLKEATPVLANISIPSTIALVSQIRDPDAKRGKHGE